MTEHRSPDGHASSDGSASADQGDLPNGPASSDVAANREQPAAADRPRPFSCLWCGTVHRPRSADDLEAWARLCPDCLGRAQENEFLRFRLRDALAARARADAERAERAAPPNAPAALRSDTVGAGPGRGAARPEPPPERPAEAPGTGPDDDWYLGRGAHARGTIQQMAWQAELDAATTWLDAQALGGRIVELAAGTGWWSPLLAGRGELWVTDPSAAALDRARARLVAHGLRAHLHVRDPWAPPDGPTDVLVAAFWLGRIERGRLQLAARLARSWLRDGGQLLFLDVAGGGPEPSGAVGHRLDVDALAAALRAAGFAEVALERPGPQLVLGRARA